MKVRDLDGMASKWKMTRVDSPSAPSQLHIGARELLHELFPTLQILEEVTIFPKRGMVLYLDFYIPLINVCIEVHGEQHYRYNTLYHNTRQDFISQKQRDSIKKQWCNLNGITVVELPYNEDKNEWTRRIKDR